MARFHRLIPLAATVALTALGSAQAQTVNRSVVQVPQRPAPAAITPAAPGPALPNAAGLPSPLPFPAGLPALARPMLTPPVTSATTTAAPVTPPADGTVLMPATAIGGPGFVNNASTVPAVGSSGGGGAATGAAGNAGGTGSAGGTAVLGAGGGGSTPQYVPTGPGAYTALQLAQSFLFADANRDGELTRNEFQRLPIAPGSFDEVDRNRNGVISRSEYEDGTR